eukprot:Plantae.Rhodophyta-Purpureofilum_apyrenoidigerum.ctg15059.p1 GENE.Plantae.Rhodophyta-Purpureofilum_apyrenoidigerum.ctg15059~~Plantae.Rhodophyta-Purpureofilum_apyrenoidigerum.ctg15059.p1  ORF type:complete len:442 (+),score=123.00 Plantae.Rhodophyta-Purpureofilum_apyrenoidigerum.ctg15059:65-1390(+)
MDLAPDWWYSPSAEQRLGPVTLREIQALDRDTLVSRSGMTNWFASKTLYDSWFYFDESRVMHGPFDAEGLRSLVSRGLVDGFTPFWNATLDTEQPAAELPAVKEHLLRIDESEEEDAAIDEQGVREQARSRNANEVDELEEMEKQLDVVAPEDPATRGASFESKNDALKMLKEEEEKRVQKKRKREREKLKKLMKNNTSVYFKNIPPDVTENEIAEYFAKCGIIKPDPDTGEPKIKLYRDDKGLLKGDGIVTYVMEPAVQNAITLLDGAEMRDGFKLIVQKAQFQIKGSLYIPREKKAKMVGGTQRKLTEKMLSWNEGTDDGRGLRIVILKHCFDPNIIRNYSEYEELQQDIEDESNKFGEVEKVTVFERNPEGAVAIKFKQSASAENCIENMNGRFFDGRKLEADFYDGKSDYRVKETEEERQRRLKEWDKWLEEGENEE